MKLQTINQRRNRNEAEKINAKRLIQDINNEKSEEIKLRQRDTRTRELRRLIKNDRDKRRERQGKSYMIQRQRRQKRGRPEGDGKREGTQRQPNRTIRGNEEYTRDSNRQGAKGRIKEREKQGKE